MSLFTRSFSDRLLERMQLYGEAIYHQPSGAYPGGQIRHA